MLPQLILFLTNALAAVPSIVQAATTLEEVTTKLKAHIDATMAAVEQMQKEQRNPTGEEWDAQNALIADLIGKLNTAAPGTAPTTAPVPESKPDSGSESNQPD